MNRSSYDAITSSWDAARTSFHGRERSYLDTFLDGLPLPSRILDLGCGTGRPLAAYVLSRGHRLTGVDQASKLIELARSRYPQANWIESCIEAFEPTEQFAGVVCWDALFHIERSLHGDLLARIATMVGVGGRLMLTVGGSDHPAFTDTMFGETFFYDSHPPEEVLSLLLENGFETIVSELMDEPTSGRDKGRYAIVARMKRPPKRLRRHSHRPEADGVRQARSVRRDCSCPASLPLGGDASGPAKPAPRRLLDGAPMFHASRDKRHRGGQLK